MAQPRYAKLKGDAWRSPKLARLSDAAFRLYINCVSYCADNLTDGDVPAHIMPALLPSGVPLDMPLAELSAEPELLLRKGQVYQVAKYLDHNVSKAEIEKHSESQRKKAQKRWGKTPKPEPEKPKNAGGIPASNAKYKYNDNYKNKNTTSRVWMVGAINVIYREVFGTDWFGYAKYHDELEQLGLWAKQQASADGCSPHDAIVVAGKGWAEDPYVIKQGHGPLPLLWRKAPFYYAKGKGHDSESLKKKLQELELKESQAYERGDHDESQRLQKIIAEVQQSAGASGDTQPDRAR